MAFEKVKQWLSGEGETKKTESKNTSKGKETVSDWDLVHDPKYNKAYEWQVLGKEAGATHAVHEWESNVSCQLSPGEFGMMSLPNDSKDKRLGIRGFDGKAYVAG